MARLDPAIEKLFKQPGAELLFETGSGITLRAQGGALTPLVKQTLTTQQLVGALTEIVPSDLRAGFPAEGVTTFPYLSPSGAVQVRMESEGGHVRAVMTAWGPPTTARTAAAAPSRAAAPAQPSIAEAVLEDAEDADGQLELASPAEMLELAMGPPRQDPPCDVAASLSP